MNGSSSELQISDLKKLYNVPLPSNRNGALYNAFSYPTKISPESIAIFIACHTNIGATVLDTFAGSGTTGLAAKLCDNPTPYMINTAEKLGLAPKWGERHAILYELSTLGSLVSEVMCTPPPSEEFEKIALALLDEVEEETGRLYEVTDPEGKPGVIRYVVWSEVLVCPHCKEESTFWDVAVTEEPLSVSAVFQCPFCQYSGTINKIERSSVNTWDEILNKDCIVKKRLPVKIYGRTEKKNWSRVTTQDDIRLLEQSLSDFHLTSFPVYEINWGVLHRKGYHQGISHLHHFYTKRNAVVFSRLWSKINNYPEAYRKALQVLLLSYNSSHSTLMTRVVVKKDNKELVITGAQSGVLYVSNLPVEKNILDGVRRKVSTIKQAFILVEKSKGSVRVYNKSSTEIDLPSGSIDYVFTDPPFGDFIPYSEINQINEAWLGRLTQEANEVVVNESQEKGIAEYKALMEAVFRATNRVLKPDGALSLVFHAAKAEIWQALISAYQSANFEVLTSSILDKIQGSFKQVVSNVKVQGDPLLLLCKTEAMTRESHLERTDTDAELISRILDNAFVRSNNPDEQKPERLFSRYVNACLESGKPVMLDAAEFYKRIRDEIPKHVAHFKESVFWN